MKNLNLERITLVTLGYGLIGGLFDDKQVSIPILSSLGLTISTIDEFSNRHKMNLLNPAICIIGGGILGQLLEDEQGCYTLATLGGIIGYYKSYLDIK